MPRRVSIKPTVPIEFFPTTRWSLLDRSSGGQEAEAAVNELCALYWRPLLGCVKRHLPPGQDAEDVAQEYVESLLRRRYWTNAVQGQGKFRAFLQKDLRLFLSGWLERTRAAKRGGGITHVPIEVAAAELSRPPVAAWFDHEWARETLLQAWLLVRQDYSGSPEREHLFRLLEPWLDASETPALCARLAAQTGIKEEKVYRTLHDLRSRFRLHFESLVRATVSDPSEVPGEVNYLFQALCLRSEQVVG